MFGKRQPETPPAQEDAVPYIKTARCLGAECVNYTGVECVLTLELDCSIGKLRGRGIPMLKEDCRLATYKQICGADTLSPEDRFVGSVTESPNGTEDLLELASKGNLYIPE